MSTNTAAVDINRGRLPLKGLAMIALLVSVFFQGLGGALTTGSVPLASATLIVVVGTPILFVISLAKYRFSMFNMGTRGDERTKIFETLGGGFTVDAAVLRWIFVVVIGLTSLGINIGIAEADGSIGTGPRTAIQTLGTLLAGVTIFVVNRHFNQIVMRVLLFGGVAFAVAVFSSDGELELRGILWSAVVGLHMFAVQKALTAFGRQTNPNSEASQKLSQRYRDSGMTMANGLTFVLILGWAWLNDGLPTPDKFAGALLPVGVLYLAIPLAIMVIPVLGMNWARNHLEETEQAMLTSTAPIAGAIAALSLAVVGWANTPALDLGQWVGIGIVVLAALAAGLDVTNRNKANAELNKANAKRIEASAKLAEVNSKLVQAEFDLDQKSRALTQVNAEFKDAQDERNTAITSRNEAITKLADANTELTKANAKFDKANAKAERLQTERDTEDAGAEPPANLGARSVRIKSLRDVVITDAGIRFGHAGGFSFRNEDGVSLTAAGVSRGSVSNDGHFTGGVVTNGTVDTGGAKVAFRRGVVVEAKPTAGCSFAELYGVNSGGVSAAE